MAKPCDMKVLEVKKARFAVVVEKCGQPAVYTLWQKPATDRKFQSLIKSHKVMTVQSTEAGSEFGIADYCERKGARYLAFPKSLKRFADRRIVGIKWDLVNTEA
jgi:hypothetical protein